MLSVSEFNGHTLFLDRRRRMKEKWWKYILMVFHLAQWKLCLRKSLRWVIHTNSIIAVAQCAMTSHSIKIFSDIKFSFCVLDGMNRSDFLLHHHLNERAFMKRFWNDVNENNSSTSVDDGYSSNSYIKKNLKIIRNSNRVCRINMQYFRTAHMTIKAIPLIWRISHLQTAKLSSVEASKTIFSASLN